MLRIILLIGAGGFLGSVFRYLTQYALQKFLTTSFPVGTMAVNILGSFFVGMIYALAERSNLMSFELRAFLAIGICGGYTTFSSYAFDNLNLLKDSGFLYLAGYMGGSVFLGLMAAYIGMQIFRLF